LRDRKRAGVVSAIVAGLVIVILALAFRRNALHTSPEDEFLAALREAPYRSLEPRLSISPTHRPYLSQRNASAGSEVVEAAVQVVARAPVCVETKAALAHLVTGSMATALRCLERQAVGAPTASAWNDYAAALLVAARVDDDPIIAVDALAACDRALALNPTCAEALFNRALALRDLGLLSEGSAAWRRYLEMDRASKWATEAARSNAAITSQSDADGWTNERKRLEANTPDESTLLRLAHRYPQQMRVYAEGVWPAEWADATRRGDPSAGGILARTRLAARALRKVAGETLADDAVAAIDRAGASDRRKVLVDAYLAYRGGRVAHSRNDPVAAEQALREAERLFDRAESPMAYAARYYVGSALFEQWKLADVKSVLDGLARLHLEKRGYHALSAQIGWERGATEALRGAWSSAHEIYADSRRELQRLGERDLAASFDGLIAGLDDFAGDPHAAWRARRGALLALSHTGNRQRVMVSLQNAATLCAIRKEWSRALALLRITTAAAETSGNAAVVAHAWNQRTVVEASLGDGRAARTSLTRARQWVARISDVRHRERAESDAAYAEALIHVKSDPGVALAKLDVARRFAETSGERISLPRIDLQAARARRQMSDLTAARNDLEHGLGEIERQRGAVRDLQQRASMFAAADDLFEEAISIALTSRDWKSAFDLAERQRSRTLLDTFAGGLENRVRSERPLTSEEIRRSLAPDAALVSYTSSPSTLTIFVVRADGLTVESRPVPRSGIESLVEAFRNAVDNHDYRHADGEARRLSALLIDPIGDRLQGTRQIAFIPDRSIASLSFAMLPLPKGLLLDNASVFQSPSASMAIQCSRRAQERTGDATLAVGGSVFDRNRYNKLPPLNAALAEARAVAARHQRAKTLTGEEATPDAVLRELANADIVHLAAHAIRGRSSPSDSGLLLAPGLSDHGELRAADVAAVPLPRTRLVVLAACATGDPKNSRDGVGNLATAFLQSGVPTVVATMWDAEDEPTSKLMTTFHRHLESADTAAALHAAMRDVSSNKEEGFRVRFGGMTIIGGTSTFVHSLSAVKPTAPAHKEEKK